MLWLWVWFMMKRMIDDMVKGYEWNKNCGCDDGEIDFVEVMKGFDIKDCLHPFLSCILIHSLLFLH